MILKLEKLLNNDNEELFTWTLCDGHVQICAGPIFKTVNESKSHAEHFIALFNSDTKININEKSLEKVEEKSLFKRGFQLITGGKS